MAKKVLQISKYSGGLNSYSDPRDLKEDEFQVLDNAAVDEEGIIRVSGALELKENISLLSSDMQSDISLSSPGKGLFSFGTDYYPSSVGFNTYLEPVNISGSSAWGVNDSDGDGTWIFGGSITNTNGNSVGSYGMTTAAMNYLTYAIANDATAGIYNHGSLSFKNLELKAGGSYDIRLNCISEKPWRYLGSNIPPRIRLFNSTLGVYLYPDGWSNTSDATHTALLDNDIGNFVSSPSGEDTSASGNITYGSTSWTASTNCKVSRVAIDADIPVEIVKYAQDRIISGGSGSLGTGETDIHWAEYSPDAANPAFAIESNKLAVTGTSDTDAQGAALSSTSLMPLTAGETYTVKADVVSTSSTIDTFYFELGGTASSSFNIGTGTTGLDEDITLPSTYTDNSTNRTLRIYAANNSTTKFTIDNVSVYSSESHKSYNSFFGSTDVSGAYSEGTAYAMKVEAYDDAAGPFEIGNYVQSHEITVVADTTYLFDCIYNTAGLAGTDSYVGVRIYDETNNEVIITQNGIASSVDSKWRHIRAGASSGYIPNPMEVLTPNGCVSIRIQVGVDFSAAGVAYDRFAYFSGFNLRKKMYELQYLYEVAAGNLFPYLKNPNSWNGKFNGTSEASPYLFIGLSSMAKKKRQYKLNVTISDDFDDSNGWELSLETGVWGGLNQSGVSNILVEKIDMTELPTGASPELSQYGEGRGNVIISQEYNEQTNNTYPYMYQYIPSEKQYVQSSYDITLPSLNGKSNFKFVKGSKDVYFCDENFYDINLYKLYNEESSKLLKQNRLTFNGPFLSNITNDSSLSGVDFNHKFDVLQNYLSKNTAINNQWISMMSPSWIEALGGGNDITHELPWINQIQQDGDLSIIDRFNDYTGNVNEFTHDVAFNDTDSPLDDEYEAGTYLDNASMKAFKYDVDDSQAVDATNGGNDARYTKYFTIKNDDIVGTDIDKLLDTSRIAMVEISLSHFVVGTDSETNSSAQVANYVPEMTIYLDAITPTAADSTGYAIPGTAGHYGVLGSVTINPGQTSVGLIQEEDLKYESHDNGNLSDEDGSPWVSGWGYSGNFNNNWQAFWLHHVAKYKDGTIEDADNPYHKIKIFIDYNALVPQTSSGVTVGTSGTDLQLRFVPKIKPEMDMWHNVNAWPYGYSNNNGGYTQLISPGGIFSEAWKIDDIHLYSYVTAQSSTTSDFFDFVGDSAFVVNIVFETPSEGEADGWDDEWTLVLTSVNKDGIESAIGNNDRIVSNTDITKCPRIDVLTQAYNNHTINNNKLIKGYVKSKRNSNYNLQFTIDCEADTIMSSTSTKKYPGVISTNAAGVNVRQFSLQSKDLLIPNEIDSYESETGVLIENALNPNKMIATFKTAVIANNTLYAGNVYQNGVHHPDRMLKSPIGKIPLLPSTNFIDVAINDGDAIVSLQFYKDKILQFKREKLFVISTSEDYEYLEDTIENVGITQESQVTRTPHGIVWINSRGCYLYDGTKVNYLTDGKLAYKKWKDSESSWEVDEKYGPSITYLKKDDKLLIYGATDSVSSIKESEDYMFAQPTPSSFDYHIYKQYLREIGYQFDFKTKSWSIITSFLEDMLGEFDLNVNSTDGRLRLAPGENMLTNFVYDEDGNSIFGIKPSNVIMKWDDNPKQTLGQLDIAGFYESTSPNNVHRDFKVVTKDYDFGAPSVNKRIYKVYVTFKSTDLESYKLRKVIQKQDFYSSSNVGVYYAVNGTNTWTEFSETKSSNYGTKGLVSDDSETLTQLIYSTGGGNSIVVSNASRIKVGYVLRINEEMMLVLSISGTTITVDRNYNYLNQHLDNVFFNHNAGTYVYISTGDWIVAELKPSSSMNNIDSFKLKFETKKRDVSEDINGVPPGFMINDISVIYRMRNVK